MSYKEIRQFIMSTNATKVFNATVVSDYCYKGTTWIGYDDTQSVNTKVKYAKDKGLLGYFAWQISQDDNWILSREGLYEFRSFVLFFKLKNYYVIFNNRKHILSCRYLSFSSEVDLRG